jgi:hyperosmotically inducible periplasmic protein
MSKIILNAALAITLAAGYAAAKNSEPPLTGDAAIAQKVAHEIRNYPYYTIWDSVNFQLTEGTVHLTGEVSQPWKKSALGGIVAHVNGVTAVDNELKVAPLSPFDDRIRTQVARAIYRDPVLSRYSLQVVPPIHIIVDNGHITLEGVVNTEMEKEVAGIRANSITSFGQVTNNLQVEQPVKRN